MEMRKYAQCACELLAAMANPRYAPRTPELDVFTFLESLECDPLGSRPHESFLRRLEQERQLLEQTLVEERNERKADTDVGEAFLTCRRCKSANVDTDAKQTRSADEPMTVFALCRECGNRWHMN
jgi:transcription elongation factor S-II